MKRPFPLIYKMNKEQIAAQVQAFKQAASLLLELIPGGEFPRGGIPSGHLYAQIMGSISLELYQLLINSLEKAGLIKVQNHYITKVV